MSSPCCQTMCRRCAQTGSPQSSPSSRLHCCVVPPAWPSHCTCGMCVCQQTVIRATCLAFTFKCSMPSALQTWHVQFPAGSHQRCAALWLTGVVAARGFTASHTPWSMKMVIDCAGEQAQSLQLSGKGELTVCPGTPALPRRHR